MLRKREKINPHVDLVIQSQPLWVSQVVSTQLPEGPVQPARGLPSGELRPLQDRPQKGKWDMQMQLPEKFLVLQGTDPVGRARGPGRVGGRKPAPRLPGWGSQPSAVVGPRCHQG